MFRIRIDIVSDLNSDQLIETCDSLAHVVIRHELPHGNPHYHMWVKTDTKENTLRQRFKRKFGFLKSSDYSIKKCDEERTNEYVQYMFNTKHGNKWELIDTHNFDLKLLDDLKEAAQAISDDYKQHHKKSKSITIYELATEINDTYKKTYLLEHSSREQYVRCLEIAIKICHKHKKAFEENLLRRLVTTAITIDSDQGRHTIIAKIIQKEFRDINI